jgi:hypothetical protein
VSVGLQFRGFTSVFVLHGTVNDRRRPGQRRVTTARQDINIRLVHITNRFMTPSETVRTIPGRRNPTVSAHTIRRRLRDAGLTMAHHYDHALDLQDYHGVLYPCLCRFKPKWTPLAPLEATDSEETNYSGRTKTLGCTTGRWRQIPQATIRTLVRSMRRRCTSVRSADGGHCRL